MALDRGKIAARLYPEIVDRPGRRWSVRLRSGSSRLVREVFRAIVHATLIVITRPFRRPFRRLNDWSRRHWKGLTVLLAGLIGWGTIHAYWYNRLTRLETDALTAWAQVEVEQQRRHHIQKNVVDLVIGYAEHERGLMVDLTNLRTRMRQAGDAAAPETFAPDPAGAAGAPDAATPGVFDGMSAGELDAVFPQIMLMAEQYPRLRLTENFQQLSEAIIATETRVAERIATYNDYVNIYTTALKQFPGNIFGTLWGFEPYDYYQPEVEALGFRPIDYRGQALRPPAPVTRDAGAVRPHGIRGAVRGQGE